MVKRFLTAFAKGTDDFNAALLKYEKFSQARLNKGTVLAGNQKVEEALSILDAALADNPGSALLHLNRGLIRELSGDLSGACADWTQALELGAVQAGEYLKECKN